MNTKNTKAMLVKRFFEDGLAQVSYLIGCGTSGRALVIDPHRDTDFYVREAEDEHLQITDVTEPQAPGPKPF